MFHFDNVLDPVEILADPCVDPRPALLRALVPVRGDAGEGAAVAHGESQGTAAVTLHRGILFGLGKNST